MFPKSRLIQPRGLKWFNYSLRNKKSASRLIQPRGLKYHASVTFYPDNTSRLIQPRGLKSVLVQVQAIELRRGLYSLVDWNPWCWWFYPLCSRRRGLYSLVDWNTRIGVKMKDGSVEAYTASWIEISQMWSPSPMALVEAYTASWIEIYSSCVYPFCESGRGLYSLVDWNND